MTLNSDFIFWNLNIFTCFSPSWKFLKVISCFLWFCSIEVDSCSDNPCHFNGVCEDGGSKCTCAVGFQGDRCTEGLY